MGRHLFSSYKTILVAISFVGALYFFGPTLSSLLKKFGSPSNIKGGLSDIVSKSKSAFSKPPKDSKGDYEKGFDRPPEQEDDEEDEDTDVGKPALQNKFNHKSNLNFDSSSDDDNKEGSEMITLDSE